MKRLIKITVLCLLVITSAFSLFACKNSGSQNKGNNQGITLNKTQLQTLIGDTNLLSVKGDSINEQNLIWSSSNESVAKVTDGLVESVSVGSAKIKATYGKYSAECDVTVTLGNKLPQLVIENERSEYHIGKNEEVFPFELYVLYNGKKFYDVQVDYYSSNDEIATFDAQGNLNLESMGVTTLSFSASWRGLNVEQVPSLFKTVKVEVVEEVYFYVNGLQYDVIELWTLAEFEGEKYTNEIGFDLSVDVNGAVSDDVQFTIPEGILESDGENVRAISYGTGTILLTYTDSNGNEYQSSIQVAVSRPQTTYSKNIEYFSSFVGTFKDTENGYANRTLAKALFDDDNVDGFKAFYKGEELKTENGKILGMPNDYTGSYPAEIRVETNKLVYNVQMQVYSIVVQNAEDLKLFALKALQYDNPETLGIDETKITCIDGYCEVIADIDAKGIKIEHSALDATFPYVKKDGVETSTDISGVLKRYISSANIGSKIDEGTEKFGFIGRFNGNGHTITNLDLSVEQGKTGGGLFGYILGNGIIENIAFTDMNISNSSGLAYSSSMPTPKDDIEDKKGLRTSNPEIKDVYIHLSANTVNPKGAIINDPVSNGYVFITLNNIIVDATDVELGSENTGSVFINNSYALCYQSIYANSGGLRFLSNNCYLISDSYPAYFDSSATIYGANETDGTPLDGQPVGAEKWQTPVIQGKVYSSKFNRYDSVEDMMAAGLDYSSFTSKSWIMIDEYPVFKTAAGVYAYYNGEVVYNGVIKVDSNAQGKKLSLLTPSGEVVAVDEYVYDSAELTIDDNGNVTLAKVITDEQEYSITIKCTLNGKEKTVKVKVLAYPAEYTINNAIEFSANDGTFELSDYVKYAKSIVSVKQIVGGQTYNLAVKDGKITDAKVVIRTDYSDVETSTFIVTTTDMEYRFDNVKVYSQIIDQTEDLKVFAHKKGTGRVTGYYVLARNIDANGLSIGHDETIYSSTTYDTLHSFQGVFDGRGYSINNFMPTSSGLFGAVYSDAEENGGRSVIKNVAFLNVNSQDNKNFTILGAFIESNGTALTEVTNVHVQIANTFISDYNPTTNYKGLFNSNTSQEVSSFKFTNIYVEIENEEYDDSLYLAHGSILSRDNVGVGYESNIETRSARFENVITVTKMNPCVYRQFVGSSLATEFTPQHMYAVYSETDLGGKGMKCGWLAEGEQYYHSPIAENAEKCSFIYKNVYRYDSAESVDSAKINVLVETGLWRLVDGKLTWGEVPYGGTLPDMNFDVDWIN